MIDKFQRRDRQTYRLTKYSARTGRRRDNSQVNLFTDNQNNAVHCTDEVTLKEEGLTVTIKYRQSLHKHFFFWRESQIDLLIDKQDEDRHCIYRLRVGGGGGQTD